MEQNGTSPDYCLVGEPTNERVLGDTLKIGRRGSLSGKLVVHGIQGHVAYPGEADNPLLRLVQLLHALTTIPFDQGTEHFEPSCLQLTSIAAPAVAGNVTPAEAHATFNIRFNTLYTSEALEKTLRDRLTDMCPNPDAYTLTTRCSGDAFLTEKSPFSQMIEHAITEVTGHVPTYSTSGGTSDARFIKNVCPVVEFGLVRKTIHKANENCTLENLENLTCIYHRVLSRFLDKR